MLNYLFPWKVRDDNNYKQVDDSDEDLDYLSEREP